MTDIPEGFEVEGASSDLPPGFEVEKTKAEPKQAPYRGMLLPFSTDESGNPKLDWDAGIIGSFKRAFMAPGDVLSGNLDPNSEEGRERALEFAGMASPLPAASRVARRIIPKAPSTDALKKASDDAYEDVRKSGAEYSADAVTKLGDETQQALLQQKRLRELAPQTHQLLEEMQHPSGAGRLTSDISSLDAFRQRLGDVAKGENAHDKAAASIVIKKLDEFLDAADPSTLAETIDQEVAKNAALRLRDARGNHAARSRSDKITGVEDAAELRAAAADNPNIARNIRQRVANLLLSDEGTRGLSPAEITALENVVKGTATANTLRMVGNWLGGSNVNKSIVGTVGGTAGFATGGPLGIAVGTAAPLAAGALARGGASRLTRGALNEVDELTRQRSPLYQQMLANAGAKPPVSPTKLAILQMLASGEMGAISQSNVVPNTRGPGRPRKINQTALGLDEALDQVIGTNDTFAELAVP